MEQLICPRCNGQHIIKKGFLRSGKRCYLCKDCKKSFSFKTEILKTIVPCFYCNSSNTVKAGKTSHGIQVHKCKDCNRTFSENRVQYESIDTPCPYCGGELHYKGWDNTGTVRRFKCHSCKKTFSGDLNNLKIRTIEKPCPYCGSEDVRKGGRLDSGAKRYKCNDCGKGYSEITVVTEAPHKPEYCPKCNGTHITLSGHDNKSGKQRYKCGTCGYKFVENPQHPTPIIWPKQCPNCDHVGARKVGKSGGKQRYQCFNCGHRYLEGGLYKHINEIRRKQIIHLYIKGTPAAKVAEQLQVSEKTVRNVMTTYYKHEKLSDEQKQLIYKFGIECNVPVDYLAPYINCTKNTCKKYLSQFNLKPKKIYIPTEQEKYFDRMELEKFIRS